MSCVYLVDDDASVLRATARVLCAAGFEVRAFASPVAYLDQFDPDAGGCLVLDFQMPAMNGVQLQQALAARGGAPAIVFLSGSAGAAINAQAMQGAAGEFLLKPVDADELVQAIRQALSSKRRHAAVDVG